MLSLIEILINKRKHPKFKKVGQLGQVDSDAIKIQLSQQHLDLWFC